MISDLAPLISVIIPCYNQGWAISEAIESVKNCKYSNLEIIVVNDGSTDIETQIKINSFPSDIKVLHQSNLGVGAARNHGISKAKGEFIISLDADNKLHPNMINSGLKILTANPEVGMVYGNAIYFGEKTGDWKNKPVDYKEFLISNHIDNCAIYRKEMWLSVGGYDESIIGSTLEDWSFWILSLNQGWQFRYVPEIHFYYRSYHNSKSKRFARDQLWRSNVYIQFIPLKIKALECFQTQKKLKKGEVSEIKTFILAQAAYHFWKLRRFKDSISKLKESFSAGIPFSDLMKIWISLILKRMKTRKLVEN